MGVFDEVEVEALATEEPPAVESVVAGHIHRQGPGLSEALAHRSKPTGGLPIHLEG